MELIEQVDELTTETIALRKEILIMKALIKHQNSMLKDLAEMKSQSASLKKPKSNDDVTSIRFPITTQEDLDELEAFINDDTKPQIIDQIRFLIGSDGLAKRAHKILSEEIVLNYNLNGLHNKRRLQDYPKLLEVLFLACNPKGDDHAKFIDSLRQGLRYIKHKHFKNISVQRRKHYESMIADSDPLNQKRFKEDDDDDDDDDDD